MSTVVLPLTMYRPRPLQRCSTTLFFLLTSLTWGLLSVWLGAWHRELDPPRWVSVGIRAPPPNDTIQAPQRFNVQYNPKRTGDTDINEMEWM